MSATKVGVKTECKGCGRTAPGIHPSGWLVLARYGKVGRVWSIVGEIPYCPDCRRDGKVRYPEDHA